MNTHGKTVTVVVKMPSEIVGFYDNIAKKELCSRAAVIRRQLQAGMKGKTKASR